MRGVNTYAAVTPSLARTFGDVEFAGKWRMRLSRILKNTWRYAYRRTINYLKDSVAEDAAIKYILYLLIILSYFQYHVLPPRHNCPECNKSFLYESALKRHMSSHDGTKQFVCSTCGSGYNYKQTFIAHMTSKHPEIPIESVITVKKQTGQGRLRDRLRLERLGEGFKRRKRGPNRKSLLNVLNNSGSNSSSQPAQEEQHTIPPPAHLHVSDARAIESSSFYQHPTFQQQHHAQSYFNYSGIPVGSGQVHDNLPDRSYGWQLPLPGQTQSFQTYQHDEYHPDPRYWWFTSILLIAHIYSVTIKQTTKQIVIFERLHFTAMFILNLVRKARLMIPRRKWSRRAHIKLQLR